jgi:YjbE family integral membrane protein
MHSAHSHYLLDCLSIIVIDLLLAGDNALVIAMVVRALPARQRRIAIACGAGLAVLLRVAITVLAARLLRVEFLQMVGGAFVVWIAVKVLLDAGSAEPDAKPPAGLLQATLWIVLADLTMSTDNVLAVAGASKGNVGLIAFGLCLSIPFVVVSSSLLSDLMDRYPFIVYAGAAILGKVGGQMIVSDPFIAHILHPSAALGYGVEAMLAVGVVIAGRLLGQSAGRAASAAAAR